MNDEQCSVRTSQSNHNWWQYQIIISRRLLLILSFLVVLTTLIVVSLVDYPLSCKVQLSLFIVFCSGVGSLIGVFLTKKRDRGLFLGAIIGEILVAVLMC
jgi:hypothetical protein